MPLINTVAIPMLIVVFGAVYVQSFPTRRVDISPFEKIIFHPTLSKHLIGGDCPVGQVSCNGVCCFGQICCGMNGACCTSGQYCCGGSLCCSGSCCGSACCLFHQTCCGSHCCMAGQTCCGGSTCCNGSCSGTQCTSLKNRPGPTMNLRHPGRDPKTITKNDAEM